MRSARLVAICALAVLALSAPALAGGRNDVYIGEVEQPPIKGFPQEEKIELYVHTQHHRDGSVKVVINRANIFNVYATCLNGHHIGTGFNPRGDAQEIPLGEIPVERGSFKSSGVWQGADPFTFKGTIPKHGPASGTLSVSENVGVMEGEFAGEEENWGNCHSGLLHWSAKRQ